MNGGDWVILLAVVLLLAPMCVIAGWMGALDTRPKTSRKSRSANRGWSVVATIALAVVATYIISTIVTNMQRTAATSGILARIAALHQEHAPAAVDPPRESISPWDLRELFAPFGAELEENPDWVRFKEDIPYLKRWERGVLTDAQAWLDGQEALLAAARDIVDRSLAVDNNDPLLTTKVLSPEMFLNAGYVLILATHVNLAAGNPDAAFADTLRIMNIADFAGTPQWLIWQAIRRRLYGIVLDILPDLVPELSPEQREAILARLATAHGRGMFIVGATGELAILIENSSGIADTPVGIVARPWLNANMCVVLRGMSLLLDAVQTPFSVDALLATPAPSRIPIFFATGESIRDSLLWSYRLAVADHAVHEAYVDVARVALALWEYREAMGTLPATLDELAPRLHGTVPRDPFAEQPMIYRRLGTYFELRSTGPNGIDDIATNGREDDDIVWRGS